MRETVAAMAHLDRAVTGAGGVSLRYGNYYGDPDDPLVEAVRTRKFHGSWSSLRSIAGR
jgi:hypothetical protein